MSFILKIEVLVVADLKVLALHMFPENGKVNISVTKLF